MAQLERTEFGNPILRQPAKRLSKREIVSPEIQQLVVDMRTTLKNKQFGVGLAAPQVGRSVAISVIGIKPTPTRQNNPTIDMVIINPEIIATSGELEPMWEGCISFGGTDNFPYAQVPRYPEIMVLFTDEKGKRHEQQCSGILAHVIQHEVDHLNGILFVDRVIDTTTYMTVNEYKRRQNTD
jgi:peptide deformylase